LDYVWVHVHEGTLISSFKFGTLDDAQAFRAKYDGEDENNDRRDPDDVPYLPGVGYRDDPDSDTWVLVEGVRIEYVANEEVRFHREVA
jgi:hypothetical protein